MEEIKRLRASLEVIQGQHEAQERAIVESELRAKAIQEEVARVRELENENQGLKYVSNIKSIKY